MNSEFTLDCDRVVPALDDYLSRELPEQSMTHLAAHLESCSTCSEELLSRIEIRNRLKQANDRESAPSGLRERIRSAWNPEPSEES